jgi:hypothetical protein
MDRLDTLVQTMLVVLVLLLKMLGAQQQALAPEYFAGHVAGIPLGFRKSGATLIKETITFMAVFGIQTLCNVCIAQRENV